MTKPSLSVLTGEVRDGPEHDVPASIVAAGLGGGAVICSWALHGMYRFEAWAPAALVVLAVLVAVVLTQPLRLARPAQVALAALLGLLSWAALSMSWAPSVARAWTEVNRLVLYAAVFTVATLVLRSPRSARAAVGSFALGVSGLGVFLLAGMAVTPDGSQFLAFRLAEPVGYSNGMAGLVVMGALSLLGFAELARTGALRGVCAGAAAALVSLAAMTQSRAILPTVVVAGLVLLVGLPGRQRRAWLMTVIAGGVAIALPFLLDVYAERTGSTSLHPADATIRRAAIAALLSAGLVGAVWGLATSHLPRRASQRVRRAGAVVLPTLLLVVTSGALAFAGGPVTPIRDWVQEFRSQEMDADREQRFVFGGGRRYDLWRVALVEFADHPLRGVGAGNYSTAYLAERRTLDYVRQPHSIELQLMAELGLPGLLAFLAFVAAVLAGALRPPRIRLPPGDLVVTIGAVGVFVGWLTHTSFDWLYNLPAISVAAFTAAGVLVARRPRTVTDPTPESRVTRAQRLTMLVAVGCVALAASGIGRQYAAVLYRERGEDRVAHDPQRARSDARLALALNPADMDAHYVLAAAEASAGRYDAARAALHRAARREPFNYVPWVLLGDLAVRRADLAQARRDYARARRLNPREPSIGRPAETRP